MKKYLNFKENLEIIQMALMKRKTSLEKFVTSSTSWLPPSDKLVSLITGEVKVTVQEVLGSFSLVTIIAASSTHRLSS